MEENLLDKTPRLSTIHPLFASTDKKNKTFAKLNTEKSETENSFGLISVHTEDLDFIPERYSAMSDAASIKIRDEARETLKRSASVGGTSALAGGTSGLPSRYLLPSEITKSFASTDIINLSGSTISESDLFRSKNFTSSSTPRNSVDDRHTFGGERTGTLGENLQRLSVQVRNEEINIDQFSEEFRKTMNNVSLIDYNSFISGDDVEAKLQADERSWREKNGIPGEAVNFSVGAVSANLSIGEYFKIKSDNIPFAKSPVKQNKPMALIEMEDMLEEKKNNATLQESSEKESLSLSKIAEILSDPNSVEKALNDLIKNPSARSSCCSKANKENNYPRFNFKSVGKSCAKLDSPPKPYGITKVSQQRESPQSSPDIMDYSVAPTSRSASALSHLPNGRLPIGTSKRQLVWECVKVSKTEAQEFIIKNKSEHRLKIQCSISNPIFKIVERNDLESNIKLLLQPHESRTITVIFMPNRIGAAVGEIIFTSLDFQNQLTKQIIKLYAYGGYSQVFVTETFKDLTGKLILSLPLNDNSDIKQTFVLRNMGTLPAFAFCDLQPKVQFSSSPIRVAPKFVVLLPKEEKQIIVDYNPTREDLKWLKNSQNLVTELGMINLITGPEITRFRIRKLCANQSDIDPICSQLQQTFPGEIFPTDLKLMNESPYCLKKLITNLNRQEVVILLDQDSNKSSMTSQFELEDTVFFTTLDDGATQIFNGTVGASNCKVEPNNVILTNKKTEDFIFITSMSMEKLKFKIDAHCLINIEPKVGFINKGETVSILVKIRQHIVNSQMFQVNICVDCDNYPVEVKFLPV